MLYLDSKNTNFRFGDILLLEKKYLGQIISLRDNHTILLLLTKEIVKENIFKTHEIVKINFSFDTALLRGKIVDTEGKIIPHNEEKQNDKTSLVDLNNLLFSSKLTSSLTKRYRKRNLTEETIFTGSLIIDYGCPLYKGNFHMISGKSKLGKKTFLRNITVNFLSEKKKVLNHKHLIYLTYSRSQAINLKKLCSNNGKFKINIENITIFTLSENPSDSEIYYLPTIALNYANRLIESNSNENLDIVFCFDDISQFIFKEKTIFDNTHQPFVILIDVVGS